MTVMSTITVYCIAWIVLGQSSEQSVGPQDMNKFRTIMFVVLAIGAVASFAFHLTVTEKESSVSGYEEIQGDADLVRPMGMKDWFKEPQFYQVALTHLISHACPLILFQLSPGCWHLHVYKIICQPFPSVYTSVPAGEKEIP